jgi:asparagine synthase (glutamine-hydrolysing)
MDRFKRFLRVKNGAVPDRFLALVSRLPDDERSALYGPALRDSITGQAASARFHDLFRAQGGPRGLAAGLYFDYLTFLPDDILALSDRLAMAWSLEIRVPFVDHVLIEALFALPDRIKVGLWWRNKRLLRRALRPRLPAAHARAPKRGFVGPTSAWLRHELREMLQDELSPQRQRRLGYFDPSVVEALLGDHFTGRQNREGILWALLCFSTWHRLYVESAVPGPLTTTRSQGSLSPTKRPASPNPGAGGADPHGESRSVGGGPTHERGVS